MKHIGILGYGAYIPLYRIKVDDIASVWGKESSDIKSSLEVSEKSVAGIDEDAVTEAYEASISAIKWARIKATDLQACFVGSESHPYAVNPTSTIVAQFLGLNTHYIACDLEFACKAATTGMIAISGLIESGRINMGIVIGSDSAQSKPHDILEYTAASAAVSFILGSDDNKSVARIIDFTSYSSDTPDFWRRDGVRFPSHGGRFTGEPAYFAHVEGAALDLLSKTKMIPSDFDYCIFHMPNGKFPRLIAKRLGFSSSQLAPSLIVDDIGNPYSASSLLGFAKVLDIAKPNKKIFMVSYGSGAGSDAFVIETAENLVTKREHTLKIGELVAKRKYISYTDYLKFSKKI